MKCYILSTSLFIWSLYFFQNDFRGGRLLAGDGGITQIPGGGGGICPKPVNLTQVKHKI